MKKIKSGFTLVELLISMGIMTILITILSQVFASILTMRSKNEATSALAQDSRYIFQRLAYDVGRSSSIAVPAVGNSGSSMTLVIAGVNYAYSLQDGALMLSVGGASADRLNSVGTSITSLSFTRNSPLGGKSSVALDVALAATTIQPGSAAQNRDIHTTLVTR